MADHKITDFVDQSAIDGLAKLKDEMISVKDTYTQVAQELIKGLRTPVSNLDQLEALSKKIAELHGQAAVATQRHAAAIEEQNVIVGRTTASIAEHLQEQNKLNREVRQSKVDHDKVRAVLEQVNGTYDQRLKRLIDVQQAMSKNSSALKEIEKDYKKGLIRTDQYQQSVFALTKTQRELAQEKANLSARLKNEEREMNSVQGSYNHMSQELELLKKAYKDLTQEEKQEQFGKDMLATINQLDTELKHQAEDMGEHQRNVGDYAIAVRDGAVVMSELNEVLSINAGTIAGCIEQNKELEKAKLHLNTADANYAQTLERINAKQEENKQRISDVSDILRKQAKSVAEAEEQNKHLAEALKLLDLTSAGAKEKVKELNDKIKENKKVIESAMPSSEGLVDSMLTLIGVNVNFGSSLKSLGDSAGRGGSILEGLGTKVKAFGSTLMGLLANPMVLAFLGIAGAAAGFKWWYDYNKGLIEATRLTKDFSGKSGAELDGLVSKIQSVSDMWGKDYKEVLNATDKMATQLGISYDEALETIKDGFIANADAQGNFLANVEKFTPALRDAGLSAKEMVAVISQTRSGLFSEDGLQAIQVASDRIKRMPKATKEALDGIGLSSKEIQKSLADGSMSMMDVIQQVSGKLKEFPQNSEAYGNAIYNVFGKKAAAGGALLVESLADVNTSIEDEKGKMGELGKLQEEQFESQEKLNRTLNAVFKASGTSFEEMITSAKTFINKGIVKIIEGCIDIVNWFIRLYNNSIVVRGAFNGIITSFKNIWATAKMVINQIIDGFKSLGEVISAVLTFDVTDVEGSFKKIKDAYKNSIMAFKDNLVDMGKEMGDNIAEGLESTLNGHLEEFNPDLSGYADTTTTVVTGGGGDDDRNGKGNKRLTEKEMKEEIKRLNDLEEAKLKAMEEGHEKELAQIRFNYNKKIREIMGNSEAEKQARLELTAAMQKELAECERKYQEQMASINLANRLAAAKKGSKEELNIKLEQLEASRAKELEEAKKTGADVSLINAKFAQQRQDLLEEYANQRVKKLQDEYSAQSVIADNAYTHEL